MKKKRQSNKDECTRVTLQEVKLHSDRNREAVAAAAILAGGLEGVEGEERNGGAFWELPKSPYTGSQNEEGKRQGGGGSSVSMATVIAIAVVFPWTHLPSSSSFLQSAPLTPSLLHC